MQFLNGQTFAKVLATYPYILLSIIPYLKIGNVASSITLLM